MIVGAGIQRVVFAGDMPGGWSLDVLTQAGVELIPVPAHDGGADVRSSDTRVLVTS
jgi:hypothetical protein